MQTFFDTTAELVRRRGLARVLRYAFEAAVVHIVYWAFRALPMDRASALGGAIMRMIGPRLKRSNTVVLPQLALAFPEKTLDERRALMLAMWDNIGRVFAEYSHLDDIISRIEIVGGEHVKNAHDSGRPTIFVSAHIGNWEPISIVLRHLGVSMHVVYRAPNNPWVESLLQRARSVGVEDRQIQKGASGARQILSVMRAGGAVGMLVDQKLSDAPLVPFFGHLAHTLPSVPVFAGKFNARVHYIHIERLEGAHFRAVISPEVAIGQDQQVYLTAMNAEVESWVRKHPAQWLWTHRRWDRSSSRK